MSEEYLYHFKKTRKQRSKLFIRMGVVFLLYIAVLFLCEHYTSFKISAENRNIAVGSFSLAALILFYVAWWHIKNPATYEAYITKDKFSIVYPGSEIWSFDVNVDEIVKIEHRQSHSSGGKSIVKTGVVMENESFHEICMNYGNNVNEMFKVLKSINPKITFPKTINKSFYLFGEKLK